MKKLLYATILRHMTSQIPLLFICCFSMLFSSCKDWKICFTYILIVPGEQTLEECRRKLEDNIPDNDTIYICPGDKVTVYWRSLSGDTHPHIFFNDVEKGILEGAEGVYTFLPEEENTRIRIRNFGEKSCASTSSEKKVKTITGPTSIKMYVETYAGSLGHGYLARNNNDLFSPNLFAIQIVPQEYNGRLCWGNPFFQGTAENAPDEPFYLNIPADTTNFAHPIKPNGYWFFEFVGECENGNKQIFGVKYFNLIVNCLQ